MNAAPCRHVGRTIRKQIEIAAPPERVWAAWADPDVITRWFVDRAEGVAKPGEVMTWHFDFMKIDQPVPVLTADPGRSLVIGADATDFAKLKPVAPGAASRPPFLMEVVIEKAQSTTKLTLVNSGFLDGTEWDAEFDGVDSGWEIALATLKHWLEHGGEHPRTHGFAMRPAKVDHDLIAWLYTTAGGLREWLARTTTMASDPLVLGSSVAFDLGGAGPLTGAVLARTNDEVLLEWRERSGLLTLKCFPLGGERRAVALDYNAWSDPPWSRLSLDSFLAGALTRLLAALAERST